MLAYADRTRLMTAEYRRRICVGALVAPTVLVDGSVRGTWKIEKSKDTAVLAIELFEPVPDHTALEEEGRRLLTFAAADVAHDVRFTVPLAR